MASGGDVDEEESPQFTSCGFCGVSSEDDDGGFDFDSAFAKSSSASSTKVSVSQSICYIMTL